MQVTETHQFATCVSLSLLGIWFCSALSDRYVLHVRIGRCLLWRSAGESLQTSCCWGKQHTQSRVVMWFRGSYRGRQGSPMLASSLTQDDPSVELNKCNYIVINKDGGAVMMVEQAGQCSSLLIFSALLPLFARLHLYCSSSLLLRITPPPPLFVLPLLTPAAWSNRGKSRL